VTLAIPVQLGLHGITMAWVAEAVLLLVVQLLIVRNRLSLIIAMA